MVQNYNQQPPRESSGMGVMLGILLAVVIAIGGYFFMQNRNVDNAALEPAAGNTTVNVETPDTISAAPTPMDSTADDTAAPAPGGNPASSQ